MKYLLTSGLALVATNAVAGAPVQPPPPLAVPELSAVGAAAAIAGVAAVVALVRERRNRRD